MWIRDQHSDEWVQTGIGTAVIQRIWTNPEGSHILALDEQGVLHTSLDRGLTWHDASPRFLTLEVDPFVGRNLIGVSESLDIVSSDDSGQTWKVVEHLPSDINRRGKIVASQDEPGLYYLAYGLSAASTIDYGAHWDYLSLPVSGMPYFAPESRLYLVAYFDLYASDDFGRQWSRIRYAEVESSFTGFGRIGQDIELAGTWYNGLFVSWDSGKTWKQTSIGSGHRVLQLWVNDKLESPEVTALIKGPDEIYLASSTDARVWNRTPIPCGTTGRFVGSVISEEGPLWQIECSDLSALIIVRPGHNLDMVQVKLPEDFYSISDALYLLDGTIYLKHSGSQQRNCIWVSFNNGDIWRMAGYIRDADWELSNDTRSGVLIVKPEGGFPISWTAEATTPSVIYIALGLYLALFGVVVFRPRACRKMIADFGRTIRHILFPVFDSLNEDMSPPFVCVVCPAMLVSSVLILHLLPIEFLHSLSVYVVRDSSLALYWGKLLERIPFLIANPDTYFFLWIVVVALVLLLWIPTIMVLASFLLGYRKTLQLWGSIVGGGLGILSTGTILFVVLLCLLVSIFTSDAEGYSSILVIGTELGGWLFYTFIAYRVVSFGLKTVSETSGIRSRKVAVVYSILFLVLSIIAELLTPVLTAQLPYPIQSIAKDIPFIQVALGNLVLVLIYHWLSPSDFKQMIETLNSRED